MMWEFKMKEVDTLTIDEKTSEEKFFLGENLWYPIKVS